MTLDLRRDAHRAAALACFFGLAATPAFAQQAASVTQSLEQQSRQVFAPRVAPLPSSTNADPTAPVRRDDATSGYGIPTRGGQALSPGGQPGSVQLSGSRVLSGDFAHVQLGIGGAKALGARGYGNTAAGAATAFHRLPSPPPPADPLTPEQRRLKAILPGATLPMVGP